MKPFPFLISFILIFLTCNNGFCQSSIQSLDLFEVSTNLLKLDHPKFGSKALEILSQRLGEAKIKTTVFPQTKAFCFQVNDKVYELMLKDSETEGKVLFLTQNPQAMESCGGEYLLPINYPKKFGAKELNPLSKKFPAIQLNVSSSSDIEKLFGPPSFKSPSKMIYNIERDRAQEKDCHQDPKKGEFQSINVTFFFDSNNKLESLALLDCISGQCACLSS